MNEERFAQEFGAVASLVERHSRFLVLGHVDPDGDCIGSMLAIASYLRGKDKAVACFTPGDMADIYRALPLVNLFISAGEIAAFKHDMVFALDSPTTARTSDYVKRENGRPVVNIDHHPTNERYGDVNIVDDGASAAAVLVYRFLESVAPESITAGVADYLYLGVLMDTGGFRFQNTNAETFRTAARFVELGARPHEMAHEFIYAKKFSTLKLLAEALESLEMHGGGKVAAMSISQRMLERAGGSMSDTEGFVDYAASIDDVELAVLLREVGEGEVRVSLRSRNNHDVASLAERYGGGGHRNAAGLTIRGDLDSARSLMIGSLEEMLAARDRARKP